MFGLSGQSEGCRGVRLPVFDLRAWESATWLGREEKCEGSAKGLSGPREGGRG